MSNEEHTKAILGAAQPELKTYQAPSQEIAYEFLLFFLYEK